MAELGLNFYRSIKSMKARSLGSLQSFLSLVTLAKSPWIYLSELKYVRAIDPCICSRNLMALFFGSFSESGTESWQPQRKNLNLLMLFDDAFSGNSCSME